MNKASGTLTTLAIILLTACQASGPSRAGEEEGAVNKDSGKVLGTALSGRVSCAAACTPSAELLDAASQTVLQVGADGAYRLPSRETGVRYLALSANGYLPQLLRLEAGEAPPAVTLEPVTDPRQGHLFGVTLQTVVGGKRTSASTLRPVPGTNLIITRGRARQEITSDARGEFRLALPAGHYDLYVNGRRQPFELPQQGSLFLPVVVGTTMID